MGFEPLRHILSKTVTSSPQKATIQIARVFDVCDTVLAKLWGPERAAYVKPVSFKEGSLKLEVSSAAALQQVKVDRVRLQNEVNRLLGHSVVRSINPVSKGF